MYKIPQTMEQAAMKVKVTVLSVVLLVAVTASSGYLIGVRAGRVAERDYISTIVPITPLEAAAHGDIYGKLNSLFEDREYTCERGKSKFTFTLDGKSGTVVDLGWENLPESETGLWNCIDNVKTKTPGTNSQPQSKTLQEKAISGNTPNIESLGQNVQ